MKLFLSVLIVFSFPSLFLHSQTEQWVARYNIVNLSMNSQDKSHGMTIDNTGNIYVTGESYVQSTGQDYATVKYNPSGVQLWQARYNGSGSSGDVANAVVTDNSGNVYVTGGINRSGFIAAGDCATIKYNSNGVEQWAALYTSAGSFEDIGTSIAVDNSGNVYITGFCSSNASSSDFLTVKYNSAGVEQWAAKYNGPGNNKDEAISVAVDNSGNVFVAGSSFGIGTNYDYAVIKYNANGVQQWAARYNANGFPDNVTAMKIDNSGNIYATGYVYIDQNNINYTTIKCNTSGAIQWASVYDGPIGAIDKARAMVIDASGNVFVTGESQSVTSYDYATIKYNSAGTQQWVSRYNGPRSGEDIPKAITLDNSDNIYVTGGSYTADNIKGYASIKYNSSGQEVREFRYTPVTAGVNEANSIMLDNIGNVYVSGSSDIANNSDYVTIKYGESVGIVNISNQVPDKFSLEQNYPNPFNPQTSIEFSLPENSFVRLNVFDINGREIQELVNQNFTAGEYKYEFNAMSFPSGTYFYKLTTEKFSQVKKMILLK